jgi:hypothetical protein
LRDDRDVARSREGDVEGRVRRGAAVSYGQGRAKKGFMAMATVPAAKSALERRGIGLKDVKRSRRTTRSR